MVLLCDEFNIIIEQNSLCILWNCSDYYNRNMAINNFLDIAELLKNYIFVYECIENFITEVKINI